MIVLIKILGEEISEIDAKSSDIIANSSESEPKVEILKTMLGIGKCLAIQLVSFLPKLGDKSYISNELSVTVNVASYARDSGRKQGRDLFVEKKNSKKRPVCINCL
ncbi:hypothetical protein MIDIC_180007 [Alphaproteobacteria bacterium]